MRRLFAAVAMLGILIAVPNGARGIANPAESQFLELINTLRTSKGLPPYTVHPELEAKARRWADSMAQAGTISHSHLEEGIEANWRKLGENVGEGPTVAELHAAFVASPSHLVNLVHRRYEYIGLGVVTRDGTIYVAQEFMQLQPPPAAPVSEPAQAPVATTAAADPLAAPVASPAAPVPAPAVTAAPAGDAPAPPPAPVMAWSEFVPVHGDTPAEASGDLVGLPQLVTGIVEWAEPAEAGPVPPTLLAPVVPSLTVPSSAGPAVPSSAVSSPAGPAVAVPSLAGPAVPLEAAPPLPVEAAGPPDTTPREAAVSATPAAVERPAALDRIAHHSSGAETQGSVAWALTLFLVGTGLAVLGVFQAGREFEVR